MSATTSGPTHRLPAGTRPRTLVEFALVIVFTLAGCNSDSESTTADESPAPLPVADGNDGGGGGGGGNDGGSGGGDAEPDAMSFRSIDGNGNHPVEKSLNGSGTRFERQMGEHYPDGVAQMAGVNLKSAREISNIMASQEHMRFNEKGASDFVWQWGQFLDHDLVLTEMAPEPANIPVPVGDPFFDPRGTGEESIAFERSLHADDTGLGPQMPRQQVNSVTGWIDASNVYGSDPERAEALRRLDGSGKLKTSTGGLMPFNTAGLPNGGGTGPELFLAGDVRANEQVGLTALHTLFVREHNRIADQVSREEPLSDEEIYERARRIVGAQMQVITYNEFLPILLGPNALEPYERYDPTVDASIMNEFAAAIFRFGHSMLGPVIERRERDGDEHDAGHLKLRDAFFAPHQVIDHGIEPLLRGLAHRRAQAVDNHVIDDVRNFLFGPPGSGGFDLVALNIQRGRDHGLSTYNEARKDMGLQPAERFSDISFRDEVQDRLEQAYDSVDDVELWVGALAEDPFEDALVGELIFTVLKKQFEAVRDGDRFWYEHQFEGEELEELRDTTLADIIRRNTGIGSELQHNVFRVSRR